MTAGPEQAGRPVESDSRVLAVSAARAAAEKQASRIVVMDVRELIVITDYFVVASGSSDRQIRTIVEEIERALAALGRKPIRREGEGEAAWILLDFFDIVVHVFSDEQRDYYDLERLWRDAPVVEWEDSEAASSG